MTYARFCIYCLQRDMMINVKHRFVIMSDLITTVKNKNCKVLYIFIYYLKVDTLLQSMSPEIMLSCLCFFIFLCAHPMFVIQWWCPLLLMCEYERNIGANSQVSVYSWTYRQVWKSVIYWLVLVAGAYKTKLALDEL